MVKGKKSLNDTIFVIVNYTLIVLVSAFFLAPLLHVLACSFSNPEMVYSGSVGLIPQDFSLISYKKVFQEDSLMRSYLNTIIYTLVGTALTIFLQFTAAYPLSRKNLPFKKIINTYFMITMFISGGLIPTYLVVKGLGMLNSPLAVIIPGCFGLWNTIVIRTYMTSSIPKDITDAAEIDGASDIRVFVSIVLPLCKPILAVMILYAIVGYWNSYFNALIYLSDEELFPLQVVLMNILVNSEVSNIGGSTMGQEEQVLLTESLKYVTIVVSTAPILLLYPFFQKYFEKGVVMGSLKG